MKTSEQIKNITAALGEFHKEVNKVDRNSKGYNYKYASLENVLDTIREPLQKVGLVFAQFPDGDYGLTTVLVHPKSGEFFETTSQIVPVKDDPQGRGSAITYNRRYHLVSILGLTVEDDDGASASGKSNSSQGSAPATDLPWLNENDPMFKTAVEKLKSGETTMEKIRKAFKVSKAVQEKLNQAVN